MNNKKTRILKCKKKDLAYNIDIACKERFELPCAASTIFSVGWYFYLLFYETDRIYNCGLKGKWI